MTTNLERMIQLADEFFAAKNDPSQILVTEDVLERLRNMHPATLSQHDDGEGPVAWILLIPTTDRLMRQFIVKKINEKELLELTPSRGPYEAVYLCSALVLPEQRNKGLARRLTKEAIAAIRRDHPIKSLFFWGFSDEGRTLARVVAGDVSLPLFERPAS